MRKILNNLARSYRSFMLHFGRRKARMIFGFAIFFVLIVINCFLFFSKAVKTDGQIVVVIDPGHGGSDPGKVGNSSILEKDVNLSIALKLKVKLEEQGIKVIMTRDNDVCLATPGATNKKTSDMNNRIEIINSVDADCLISIHQNSFSSSSVKGAQVFYHGTSKESRELAEELQKYLIKDVDPDNHREAKQGNDYFILRKSSCPGVIIECGFLSCPAEASKLIDETYQEKIAEAICCAISNYLSQR